MQSEVTVTIKGEDSTFKKKFLNYEAITLQPGDPQLETMVKQARAEFKGIPEETLIKITTVWQSHFPS